MANRHYGYRRIGALLGREGWQVNHKRVLRVMGEDNLLCLRTRPFVPRTTESRHSWRVVPNLARGMELTGVNQLWVADITYLHLAEQFAYLAVVLDAFSRKVIGWALELHLRASLAVDALKMAISARVPVPGSLIHHSDRGVGKGRGDPQDGERQRAHEPASRGAQAWRRSARRACPLPALRPQAHGAVHGHQAQHSALFLLAGSARQWRAAMHRLWRTARR
ncbi:MAG: hypothetical protein E5W19_30680 [Mesorhizobium sp.]|nr:MAG: hypothetical protein E5W19_30680 [Mesorhizobium sp.]